VSTYSWFATAYRTGDRPRALALCCCDVVGIALTPEIFGVYRIWTTYDKPRCIKESAENFIHFQEDGFTRKLINCSTIKLVLHCLLTRLITGKIIIRCSSRLGVLFLIKRDLMLKQHKSVTMSIEKAITA
jgi:hypothetical protein